MPVNFLERRSLVGEPIHVEMLSERQIVRISFIPDQHDGRSGIEQPRSPDGERQICTTPIVHKHNRQTPGHVPIIDRPSKFPSNLG